MILWQEVHSLRTVVTGLVILGCLCFGGSASVVVYEMGLSIFALIGLLVFLWSGTTQKTEGLVRWLILVFGLSVAIQLMPLPDLLWRGMPQGQFAESLPPKAQRQIIWQSLSISPESTLYSLLAAAPALIVLWLVAGMNQFERNTIANILIIAVLFQAIIGIVQAASFLSLTTYTYSHKKVAIGLFASRNHYADLILIGTSLMFAIRKDWLQKYGRAVSEIAFHMVLLVFLLAIISSASRSGVVLFVLMASIGYAIIVPRNKRLAFSIFASIVGGLLWVTLNFLPQTGVVKSTLARFEMAEDGRWEIWENSWVAAASYWPWGAGLSNFRHAYEAEEPLGSVTALYINAAHNEYLQFIIENGVIGLIALSLSITLLAVHQRFNDHNRFFSFIWIALLTIIFHSFVDYPFRVMSLNVLIACLVAFAISPPSENYKRLTHKETV